jgi:8-oxo-dGTP pyrophosphatase MutT (NUDIX family)
MERSSSPTALTVYKKGATIVNKARAYGGIVVDDQRRILLRRPKNDFDGYVWTFPKGRPNLGETAEDAALREVKEETGYSAKITGKLPGLFDGGTTVTEFFLMAPFDPPLPFDEAETDEVCWATPPEAARLIAMTTNLRGKVRDLAVLEAVVRAIMV